MRKIFRMASAELNKIFARPSMFVLFTVLVGAMVLSFFMFNPISVNAKYTYQLNSTSAIYLKFEEDYETLEQELITAKTSIDDFLSTKNDTLAKFQTLFQTAKNQFYNQLYVTVVEMPKQNEYPSGSVLSDVKYEFGIFRQNIEDIRSFMISDVNNKEVNFFITTSQNEKLYNTIKNIAEVIPTDAQIDHYTTKAIIDRINLIKNSFDLEKLNVEVNNLEKIEINSEELTELLNLYYTPNISESTSGGVVNYTHTGKLEELYNAVAEYYYTCPDSAEAEKMDELNEHIARYYDYIQICKNLLNCNFELLRIGNKTDDQIVTYNGFSGVSIYNLKQSATISNYFLENNTFGYEYLTAFNFGINSGTETNCFDFAFYAMQILSFLITLFVMFFACGMIAGEQNSGTLKMTAIRPYSRNKIYSGKFLACINVSLILLFVSFIASMAIGIASFGYTTQNVLVVANASTVSVISPLLLIGIYFVSILIDIIFYIALAIFISMIIKPTTISTAISSAVLIVTTILSGTTSASFIRFIPTAHTGLFKFFTTSNLGIFSYSIVPGINMITSIIVLAVSLLLLDLFGRYLFTHRSIDK